MSRTMSTASSVSHCLAYHAVVISHDKLGEIDTSSFYLTVSVATARQCGGSAADSGSACDLTRISFHRLVLCVTV